MPIVILLIVIIVVLLGGGGIILGSLWGLLVLLWVALPWIIGFAVLVVVTILLKAMSPNADSHGKPHRRQIDHDLSDAPHRPHVVNIEARAAMEEQQRLNDEYRAKIAAARQARGE